MATVEIESENQLKHLLEGVALSYTLNSIDNQKKWINGMHLPQYENNQIRYIIWAKYNISKNSETL